MTLEKLIVIFEKSEVLMWKQQPAYCIVQGAANVVHDMQSTTPEG